MKYNFYEYLVLNLKVTINYGIMDAHAANDVGELEFYKKLKKLLKQLETETKQFIAEKEIDK